MPFLKELLPFLIEYFIKIGGEFLFKMEDCIQIFVMGEQDIEERNNFASFYY
jgi:hypothetical protein